MESTFVQDWEQGKHIPFGKFFDVNGSDQDLIKSFELVKFHRTESAEPAAFFLFKTDIADKYYCAWEYDFHLSETTEADFHDFIGNEFGQIRLIEPKNKDWYQTHWMYELTKN